MIYGNTGAQNLLQSFVDTIHKQGISHPFLIISGPNNSGKITCILNHVKSLTHPYESDFLFIEDLSSVLNKNHTIKIEKSKKKEDQYIRRHDGSQYEDIGMRELQERYQKSPLGTYKIVVIEHIERMNPSSANALLKTLEEPQHNHLIIATTKEYDRILPTIRSRGLVMRWQLVSALEIRNMISNIGLSDSDIDMVISYAQGAPGRGIWAATHLNEARSFVKQAHDLRLSIVSLEFVSFIQQIKQIVKDGQLLSIVDFLLYQETCSVHPHERVIDVLLTYKKYQQIQVNQEHLLAYSLLYHTSLLGG